MKLLALLFFVGCAVASSEWRWQTGKEHVFEYSGRLLTGLPELSSHYSGLGINATVVVQPISSDRFQLFIEHPRFARVNQRLQVRTSIDGPDGANWREVFLPEMTEVDSEYKTILGMPILFTLSNGEIRHAQISREEPMWSVNFKKALVILFQTKLDSTSWQIEENRVQRLSAEGENFWKVKEESIDGICENTYQINELPKYMIKDRPEMIPYPEICSEDKYYEVTKTKDVDSCEKRSSFSFYKPGRFHCSSEDGANCDTMWARSSETRYIACGTRGNLAIQTIINQGELNQNLFGMNSERFVSGNLQTLRLKEIRQKTHKVQPNDLITVKSMLYQYTLKQEYEQQKSLLEGRLPRSEIDQPHKVSQSLPKTFLQAISEHEIPKSKIMEQIKEIMLQVVRDMVKPEQQEPVQQQQITMKILSIARGIAMLEKSNIENVYQQLKSSCHSEEEKNAMKSLFFDTVLMTGTQECIYFLKEKITQGEMNKYQVARFFMWLPQNLMLPTQQVLEQLFELVKSDKVLREPMTHNIAIMSFSTLLQRACLAENRKTSYPTWVYGKFCHPDSEILKQKWLPYLFQKLEQTSEWKVKNEIIVALGSLTDTDIVGKLIPYVEGKPKSAPRMTRLLALWSLAGSGIKEPQVIEPIFHSIYANRAESTELRIAAFNVLLKINPSMAVFHKIAASTWVEKDQEVLKVVNMALFTLYKEVEANEMRTEQTVFSLPRKAYLVWPLIKKTPGILPSSATIYESEYLAQMGVGWKGLTTWIASNSSFVPTEMYSQIKYYMDKYEFSPLSLGLRLEGAENVYEQLVQLITPLREGENSQQQRQEMARQIKESIHSEWRKVMQKLDIETRKSSQNMNGVFLLNIMETTPIFSNFEHMTVDLLREKMSKLRSRDQICNTHRINSQHTFDMSPVELLIPSDMGFPINVELHMPVAMSINGELDIQCNSFSQPKAEMKAKTIFTSQLTGWVGTVIPFTKEYVMTVVDQQRTINLPAQVSLSLDIPNQHLRISAKLNEQNKPVDVLHYHVKPFTVRKSIFDLKPLTLSSNVEYIKSEDSLKTMKANFGEYLGFHLESIVKTESRYTDFRSYMEKFALYKYNPINTLRFVWALPSMSAEGKPSLRNHQYTLRFDPTQSSTKKLTMDFKVGYASKQQSEESVQYHTIKVQTEEDKQRESREESDPIMKAFKKMSPFGIRSESLEQGQHQQHEKRQEKIRQVIEHLGQVETSRAVIFKYSTTLEGSGRGRTWTYTATLANGEKYEHSKIKSKWNVQLESQCENPEKIELEGSLDMPVLPIWSAEELRASLANFRFHNSYKYESNSHEQWRIDVNGDAKVSHKQKEYSRISPEAKKCQKMIEERIPGAKSSPACESSRLQAGTVDEVDFTIKYVNVPHKVEKIEEYTFEKVKALLWPYMRYESQLSSRGKSIKDSPVMVRVLFHRDTPSYDLIINRPQQQVTFKYVRVPYPVSLMFPMKANINNVKYVAQQLTGRSLYPVCKVTDQTLQTFDNRSMPFHIDYCFHLLASDCSQQHRFAVLTRVMRPGNRRELQVFLGPHMMLLTPSERPSTHSYFPSIKITIDGEELTVLPGKQIEVRSPLRPHRVLATLYKTANNVMQLKAAQYLLDLTYDGDDIVIETSQVLKNKMCGLCGNQNSQMRDDLQGPKQCMYSKPELEVAAYRVPNTPQGCDQQKPLPHMIRQKMEVEKEQCIKHKEIPTKITKSLRAQAGECTLLKNAVIRKSGEICISKKPVTQCSPGCKVVQDQLVKKNVPFTCFKEGRVAEHYAKKASQGKRLPELEDQETSFETKVPQPRSCKPADQF